MVKNHLKTTTTTTKPSWTLSLVALARVLRTFLSSSHMDDGVQATIKQRWEDISSRAAVKSKRRQQWRVTRRLFAAITDHFITKKAKTVYLEIKRKLFMRWTRNSAGGNVFLLIRSFKLQLLLQHQAQGLPLELAHPLNLFIIKISPYFLHVV